MDYVIGLLNGAAFLACGYLFIQLKRKKTAKQQEADPEVKRRAKETHEHFQSLMNYDVHTALQRKKVT